MQATVDAPAPAAGRTLLRAAVVALPLCALLSACSSTTFVYNRLDFILPWYFDRHAHNARTVQAAMVDVLNLRGPRQDARLRRRLEELREDLALLAQQGIEDG